MYFQNPLIWEVHFSISDQKPSSLLLSMLRMENCGGGQRNSLIHSKMGKLYNAHFSLLVEATRQKGPLALIHKQDYITFYYLPHCYH